MNKNGQKNASASFLPMTNEEMIARGWDGVDVVFVTGDAYVDHPSFATALLGRILEASGFRVAVLAQPDWHSCDAWRTFGQPKLCFCISAGNMDSMINHYTASRKVRNDDAYSPGGRIGQRPDRATLAYCQRAREAYPGVTVLTGGVEASLRRLAHYDFWSDKVKRSILMDSKADLLLYGMGETAIVEVMKRLAAGEEIATIRDVRGTVYRLGMSEDLPEEDETTLHLPSYEEVLDDPKLFNAMTRLAYLNLNPYCAKRLVQEHLHEAIVVNPPSFPLNEAEMDRIYGLPFTRRPHPSYRDETVPAFDVIKNSVQILRGCFGGCSFCSLATHQGKFVQTRSKASILDEVRQLAKQPHFAGVVSDLGGPTANMYKMVGRDTQQCMSCLRTTCLHPEICENLNTDHSRLIDLMRAVRKTEGVDKVFIASGVRTDLAQRSPEYVEELIRHHVGGHLKTAPEHVDPQVLHLMRKPNIENYDGFVQMFGELNAKHHKEQYLVPYLIAGLPGSDVPSMIRVAEYLHEHNIKPQQVQDFIPGPFELATAMYYTGHDPVNGQQVHVARGMRERRMQHALLQYYKPENYHDVKMALRDYGREDLIGLEEKCLIPPYPPKELALKHNSRVKRLEKKTTIEKAKRTEYREKKVAELTEKKRKEREAKRNERRRESGEFRSSFVTGKKRNAGKYGGERRGDRKYDDRKYDGGKRSDRPFGERRSDDGRRRNEGERRNAGKFRNDGERRDDKQRNDGEQRNDRGRKRSFDDRGRNERPAFEERNSNDRRPKRHGGERSERYGSVRHGHERDRGERDGGTRHGYERFGGENRRPSFGGRVEPDRTAPDQSRSNRTGSEQTRGNRTRPERTSTGHGKADRSSTERGRMDRRKTDFQKSDRPKTDYQKTDRPPFERSKPQRPKTGGGYRPHRKSTEGRQRHRPLDEE